MGRYFKNLVTVIVISVRRRKLAEDKEENLIYWISFVCFSRENDVQMKTNDCYITKQRTRIYETIYFYLTDVNFLFCSVHVQCWKLEDHITYFISKVLVSHHINDVITN